MNRPIKQFSDMTLEECRNHMRSMLELIDALSPPDSLVTVIVVGNDGQARYSSTVDPEDAPEALRELADKIEKRNNRPDPRNN